MHEYNVSQRSCCLSPPRGWHVLSEGEGYQGEIRQPHSPWHVKTSVETNGTPLRGKEGGEFWDELKVYKLDVKKRSASFDRE